MRVRARLQTAVVAAAIFAAPACAVQPEQPAPPAPPPPPDWDMVSLEVKSWGAPVTSWRILSNGAGSWTEAVVPEGEHPTHPHDQAWHELEADPASYIALENVLRKLPDPAPDPDECENFMTDAPYGVLRMTKGATTTEIAWNDGCMDEDYRAFIAVLREADALIATRGKAAPVSRVEAATR